MSIKVKCPDCKRILKVPSHARGKAVKCPRCEAVVRIPEKAVAAQPPPSSSALIANLDLDRLEDTLNRICPKCGSEVSPEDIECPECHVNLETGTLSDEMQTALSRKGPDPKLYYKDFIRNGIEFWKKNKRVATSLIVRSAVFAGLFAFCMLVSVWSVKPLVRIVFVFFGSIALLVPPGLAWNLHATIVDATLRKKKKLAKYHWDMFLGAALGLKMILWYLVIALPLHIAAVVSYFVLAHRSATLALAVGGGCELAAFVLASLLFPITMTHMAMPVTIRGWMVHRLVVGLFRTFPAVLYWCFFLYLAIIPPLACIAAGAFFSGKDLNKLRQDSERNSTIYAVQEEIADRNPKATPPPEKIALYREYGNAKTIDLSFGAIILPSALLVAAAAMLSGAMVVLMRGNGLYARTFMDRLDLETMAPEVVYVVKAANIGELEQKKLEWSHVSLALVVWYAMGLTVGYSVGKSYLTSPWEGCTWGMTLTGSISVIAGICWCIYVLSKEKRFNVKESIQAQFAAVILGSGLVYAAVGGLLYLQEKQGPASQSRKKKRCNSAPGWKSSSKNNRAEDRERKTEDGRMQANDNWPVRLRVSKADKRRIDHRLLSTTLRPLFSVILLQPFAFILHPLK